MYNACSSYTECLPFLRPMMSDGNKKNRKTKCTKMHKQVCRLATPKATERSAKGLKEKQDNDACSQAIRHQHYRLCAHKLASD